MRIFLTRRRGEGDGVFFSLCAHNADAHSRPNTLTHFPSHPVPCQIQPATATATAAAERRLRLSESDPRISKAAAAYWASSPSSPPPHPKKKRFRMKCLRIAFLSPHRLFFLLSPPFPSLQWKREEEKRFFFSLVSCSTQA